MRRSLLCLSLLLVTACAGEPHRAPSGVVETAVERDAPPVGKWRLATFADADGVVTPEVTLIVQEDGKLAGSGGCNGYFGAWTLGPEQSTLGPVGATRRMCEPETMDVESRYFERLSRVGGWLEIPGGMTLTDSEGIPLLRFRPLD